MAHKNKVNAKTPTYLALYCGECDYIIFRSIESGYAKGEKVTSTNTISMQGHQKGDQLVCRQCGDFKFGQRFLNNMDNWVRIYGD